MTVVKCDKTASFAPHAGAGLLHFTRVLRLMPAGALHFCTDRNEAKQRTAKGSPWNPLVKSRRHDEKKRKHFFPV